MRKSIIERLCRVAFVVISKKFGGKGMEGMEMGWDGSYAIGPDEVISAPGAADKPRRPDILRRQFCPLEKTGLAPMPPQNLGKRRPKKFMRPPFR